MWFVFHNLVINRTDSLNVFNKIFYFFFTSRRKPHSISSFYSREIFKMKLCICFVDSVFNYFVHGDILFVYFSLSTDSCIFFFLRLRYTHLMCVRRLFSPFNLLSLFANGFSSSLISRASAFISFVSSCSRLVGCIELFFRLVIYICVGKKWVVHLDCMEYIFIGYLR